MGRRWLVVVAFCAITLLMGVDHRSAVTGLSIEKSAYKDVVIEIKDNVPVEECGTILADLEVSCVTLNVFERSNS